MAANESTRDRELLTQELNKLNKRVIIDILVTKVVPSDLTSDLLRNFLTKLLTFDGNEEDGSEKPEIEIVNSDKLYVSMKSEITTLQTLVQHLELRIDDQSEIISMLKSKDNTTFSEKVKMTSKKNFTEHPKVNNIDDDASVGRVLILLTVHMMQMRYRCRQCH